MGKTALHEVLAVEDNLSSVWSAVCDEASDTFRKKEHLFRGHSSSITALSEESDGSSAVDEGEEVVDVAETTDGKLDYALGHMAAAFNVLGQKESANQKAVADVIIGGKVIIPNAPATLLLALENRLRKVRDMCSPIHTLDMSKGWTAVPDQPHIRKAREERRTIRHKMTRHHTQVQATEHHPAQVVETVVNVPVGEKTVTHMSSLPTPGEKSDLLDRIDTLIRACKQARQRANKTEVDTSFRPGQAVKDFIMGKTG